MKKDSSAEYAKVRNKRFELEYQICLLKSKNGPKEEIRELEERLLETKKDLIIMISDYINANKGEILRGRGSK